MPIICSAVFELVREVAKGRHDWLGGNQYHGSALIGDMVSEEVLPAFEVDHFMLELVHDVFQDWSHARGVQLCVEQ